MSSRLPVFSTMSRSSSTSATRPAKSTIDSRVPRPPPTNNNALKRSHEDENSPEKRKRARTSQHQSPPLLLPVNGKAVKRGRYAQHRPSNHLSVANASASPPLLPANGKAVKRGRYAQHSLSVQEEQFDINPSQNNGLTYKFQEVVRGKEARKNLPAHECPDCAEYYKAMGPLPPRLQAPLWRSPSSPPPSAAEHICARKQQISRHRAQWGPSRTPPGFWDIGFPDTIKVNKINAEAARMRDEDRQNMRAEAAQPNGRYRQRA
ncbi:hypothetical protein C8F01DRAFT_1109757 [Mycena amicta]|nr:hypothetical protein C8F01DRAFT_1109757 [Mycena amicta]